MMALFLGGPRHGLTAEIQDGQAVIYVEVEEDRWQWTYDPTGVPISPARVIYVRQMLRVFGVHIMVWVPADSIPSNAQVAEVLLSPLARQCVVVNPDDHGI